MLSANSYTRDLLSQSFVIIMNRPAVGNQALLAAWLHLVMASVADRPKMSGRRRISCRDSRSAMRSGVACSRI